MDDFVIDWYCPQCGELQPETMYKGDTGAILGCSDCVDMRWTDTLPTVDIPLPPGYGPWDTSCPVCGEGDPEKLYYIGDRCVGCDACVQECGIEECLELLEENEDPGMDEGRCD